MKKYELTSEFKLFLGRKLFRIKALVSFGDVKAGELGGYVEKEENLSQDGNAWVSGSAQISGNAWVYGDAQISGNAWVYEDVQISGNAWVYGDARISGNARVSDNARVSGNARISGNAWVYEDVQISGNAWVYGDAQVSGNAQVYGNAWVSGNARISGNARVSDNARVSGNARISGNARVSDNARVSGNARIPGNAWVYGDARVSDNADILHVTGLGTKHRTTTVFNTKDGLRISCGCFFGTLAQFRTQVVNTRKGKVREEYLKFAELIEIYFGLDKDAQEEKGEQHDHKKRKCPAANQSNAGHE